jgi:hypothetical protein
MIDLVVIGFVTLVTRSFALVLGVVAAIFFIRAGFKRTPVKRSVFGRAMRFSVGCLGFFIAMITALVWSSCGIDFQGDGGEDRADIAATIDGGSVAGQIIGALATRGIMSAFEDIETIEEAEEAALQLIDLAEEIGIEPDDLSDFLTAAVPEGAPWIGEADALFTRLLGDDTDDLAGLEEATDVTGYTIDEALDAYAAVLATDPNQTRSRRVALEARLAGVVAADTVEALTDRIAQLEETNRDQQRDLENTTAALTEATSGGVVGWLRGFIDELGFGFGWASLYLTVLLSWWKGQTVGKRLMGIRVVRLDGEPITWWIAFERVGGYAAGFATGLLGFAQVYWDANRQAIHDRIVGTVVVLDGAEKVGDWESAL